MKLIVMNVEEFLVANPVYNSRIRHLGVYLCKSLKSLKQMDPNW
jgi:hypothetical protein